MSAPTPGPWVSRAVVDRHDFNATAADVQGPHGEFVADCGSHEHATANARLIAAAPQMRDALATTLGNLRSLAGNHPAVYGEWLALVEAALAAAVPPEPGR
jgi:hypothetical protein